MQAETSHIDRISLPRSLVGRRPIRQYVCKWKFKLGAVVEFYGDRAFVTQRTRTAAGRELYLILIPSDRERPYREVLGTALCHTH